MDLGLCSENQAQNEARSIQRAGQTVSSLLLSAAGPAASYCAFKQVLQTHTHTHTCAHREFSVKMFDSIFGYICRYIHIIMVFWSFLAGVVTFYCSLGPESLLPNVFISIKPKTKVGRSGTVNASARHANTTMTVCLKPKIN